MNLERIYQQTILDYNNRKDLKKELDDPTYIERGHNPNCGDDLTLQVRQRLKMHLSWVMAVQYQQHQQQC